MMCQDIETYRGIDPVISTTAEAPFAVVLGMESEGHWDNHIDNEDIMIQMMMMLPATMMIKTRRTMTTTIVTV